MYPRALANIHVHECVCVSTCVSLFVSLCLCGCVGWGGYVCGGGACLCAYIRTCLLV